MSRFISVYVILRNFRRTTNPVSILIPESSHGHFLPKLHIFQTFLQYVHNQPSLQLYRVLFKMNIHVIIQTWLYMFLVSCVLFRLMSLGECVSAWLFARCFSVLPRQPPRMPPPSGPLTAWDGNQFYKHPYTHRKGCLLDNLLERFPSFLNIDFFSFDVLYFDRGNCNWLLHRLHVTQWQSFALNKPNNVPSLLSFALFGSFN